ncbi:hypothetical protein [Mucilaginibacter dorajii]|uniref:Uncharacterized protein n=1 Tax=Mucilaginibacter dorajii TaxID=692994 RepID=A0ABP7R9W9_9SPHI|nr:hypothetical protein [Mucilaginibacter dorajii]MCS3736768.1 hypothetical protein [Mucilaginibacter dorajii]
MILEEFLKQIKRESIDIEHLSKRNYYKHLNLLFEIIAYNGERLNKKHNLMIAPYLQYIGKTKRDDFRDDLNKEELQELIENLKTDLDCIIFKIDPPKE